MKNLKLLIILFTLYSLLFTRLALASREMEDYLFQYEKYQEVYDQFKVSRDKFLKYEILSVREQAVESVKKLLLQRNQTLRTYFLVLKYKLRNTPGVVGNQIDNNLIGQLDKKIIWLEEESEEVNNFFNPSLSDLFVLSDRIEDKEKEFTQIAYQSLGEVILGKIRSLQQESIAVTTLLKDKVEEGESATKAAQLNLWLKEVDVKNYLARKEIEAAEINLWNLRSTRGLVQMKIHFNNLKIDTEDAKIQLQQASSFQNEIYSALIND